MKTILGLTRTRSPIDPSYILYLTGDINYCHLQLSDGRVLLMAHTLKWYADRWPYFVRIHKRTLVNPAYVIQLTLANTQRLPLTLLMRNEVQLTISRRRLSEVRQQLDPSTQLNKLDEMDISRMKVSEGYVGSSIKQRSCFRRQTLHT